MDDLLFLQDPSVTYNSVDDSKLVHIIDTLRQGISFSLFQELVSKSTFSMVEWSSFLHLSERTIQRYKKEKKRFDPIHSEKIVEITLLYNLGIGVFGDANRFDTWMQSTNIALGNKSPKSFLDSTFGIGLVKDELVRIEHGITA